MQLALKTAAVGLLVALNLGLLPVEALAQSNDTTTCTQWQIDRGYCQGSARSAVQFVLNFILGFLGLVAMGFLIYGGFLYVTAGSNDDNIDAAKKTIMYALIGIVIIFLAWALIATLLGGLGQGNDQVAPA